MVRQIAIEVTVRRQNNSCDKRRCALGAKKARRVTDGDGVCADALLTSHAEVLVQSCSIDCG